jgi:hypothetical protein
MLELPLALNVTQVGTHPFAFPKLMFDVGLGFTIIFAFAELLQPFEVPTTVTFMEVLPLNG